MEILKKYSLLPSQKEFLEIPHGYKTDIAVYQGGYGSGKTFCGSLLGLLLARKIAGIRGIVGALTFPVVRDTTLVSYFEHLDFMGYKKGVHYEFNKVEAKLSFKNGSEILFRYFEDAHKLKSLNIGFAQIEEMSDVPESSFNMLLSRLRQANIPRFRLFGHTNPENSKGWIYKQFIENPKPNYRLIIAPSTQNTYLPEGFIDNLKQSYDPEYYRINVLGEFGDYTKGLVTKGFNDKNIYTSHYVDKAILHLTCDFNVDPMCWIIAHRTSDKVFFIDEISVENTNTQECILEFLRRYPSHKAKIIINGDASGDNRSSSSEFTNYAIIRNALYKHGYKDVDFHLRSYNPPIKNRIAAWNSKIANAKGERTLLVSNKCEKLLYNIHNLKYKEGTSVLDLPTIQSIKGNRNIKFLGHPFDAASYLTEFYWPVKLG
jgi:PBSX family phage terminase large subunit